MSDKLFESSDSVRQATPLKHVQTAVLEGVLKLELGGELSGVTAAYETYGQLNAPRDNAVLICHAITGDSHVARHDEKDDPGWWDVLVGPGKPVDTNRFFVICPNLLGGCRGTTGPGSANPTTGKPYGRSFPTITIGDMVEVQYLLLQKLGIRRLLTVLGGSMGGHQAMTWAIRHPGFARGIIPIATSPRLTSQSLAFDVVARNAILRDPHFYNGQYYDKPHGPDVGLAIARMIGHITYLSREAMTEKFDANRLQPRDVAVQFEKKFSVGSYLGHQGEKFVERFDANSYLTLTLALDLFDMGGTPEQLAGAFHNIRGRWLVISFSGDWLFPPDQSKDIVRALLANKAAVSYSNIQSGCGHDAFLLPDDVAAYGEMIRAFLDNLSAVPSAATVPEEPQNPTSIFQERRLDYDRIIELIPPGASVLDLGCGSGKLLARLKEENHRRLMGVELDEKKILAALRRNLDVVQANLNQGLRAFAGRQFDCVVLSQTLQAVYDVEAVINEMLRVGHTGIVSFPNFAYHKLRRMLAENGRAPRSDGVLRYEWYDTPNIRFLTIADFDDFCRRKNIHVHRRVALDTEAGVEVSENPNLNADMAIFVISREDPAVPSPG
jgi:homoserine O-acetyltransferase